MIYSICSKHIRKSEGSPKIEASSMYSLKLRHDTQNIGESPLPNKIRGIYFQAVLGNENRQNWKYYFRPHTQPASYNNLALEISQD